MNSGSSSIYELSKTFLRDFVCCGTVHATLHVLLQHYEDCHVEIRDEADASMLDYMLVDHPLLNSPSNQTMVQIPESLASLNSSTSAFDTSVVYITNKRRGEYGDSGSKRACTIENGEIMLQIALGFDWLFESEPATVSPSQIFGHSKKYCEKTKRLVPGQAPAISVGISTVNSSGQVVQYGNVGRPPLVNINGVVEKRYRCPVPGCSKVYKNLNGLKYHSRVGHTERKRKERNLYCLNCSRETAEKSHRLRNCSP